MAIVTNWWLLDGLVLLVSLIILAYFYMTRNFKYWEKRGVPEIKPVPFLGNFGDCLLAKRSAGQWVEDVYNKGAGLPYLGLYIFDKPCLLIRDPELVKHVLIRDFNYFQDRYASASSQDKIGNSNIFFVKNPAWKLLRTKLTPIYTSGKLKKMFELMVEVGDDLDKYMDSLNIGDEGLNLEMKDLAAKFTTDMIGTTAFGIKVNSLNQPNSEFRTQGKKIFEVSLRRNLTWVSLFFLPEITKLLQLHFLPDETSKFMKKTMWNVLTERERSGGKRNDLIDMLIELKKAYYESGEKGVFEFDGDNLVAQTVVFFSGGFETSSSVLSFILYELALQPGIQSRLRLEILDALEKTNGEINYDMVMNLKYMDMVFSEALRIYPPLPILDRVATADYKVPDSDLVIKKGTPIFISMSGSHFDPEYFPDPLKFDPERFSEENKRTRKSCVYFPFGEGPHNCIGMRNGILQTKLGLIKLLSRFEYSPCEATPIPMVLSTKSLVIASEKGVTLNVKKLKKT